jgi:undecaprenyl-diphosphatase
MIMEIIKAIILGILEGFTEFIPVSSTGHLILAGDFLTFFHANQDTFNIAIQLGAILAVIYVYKDFFIKLLSPNNWLSKEIKLLFVAFIPIVVAGLTLKDFIKAHLFSPIPVVLALFVGGIFMLAADLFSKKSHSKTSSLKDMNYFQATIIGLAQCFALWPGMSRSGATIVGGIFAKIDYKTSAKFSFILGVPVIFSAVILELSSSINDLSRYDLYIIAIGFIVSFVFGIIAIKTMLKILNKYKLTPFYIYRIILSIILFWYYMN